MAPGNFVSFATRSADESYEYTAPPPQTTDREAAELAFSRAITRKNGGYEFIAGAVGPRGSDSDEAHYRRMLEEDRSVFGAESAAAARRLAELGRYLMNEGRYDEAEALLREALRINRAILDPGDLAIARNLEDLGDLRMRQKAYESAESLYVDALRIRHEKLDLSSPDLQRTYARLSRSVNAHGFPNLDIYPDYVEFALFALADERSKAQRDFIAVLPESLSIPTAWVLSIPGLDLYMLPRAVALPLATALRTEVLGDRGAVAFTYRTEDGYQVTEPMWFDFER
jgi:tetratricopeptide (TPR) repeat protein